MRMENYLYSTVLYRMVREENSIAVNAYVDIKAKVGFQFPVEFKTVCAILQNVPVPSEESHKSNRSM